MTSEEFRKTVDSYKDKASNGIGRLYILFDDEELFKDLIKNDSLIKDDFRYLFEQIDEHHALTSFTNNLELFQYVLSTEVISFKEMIDKYKNIKDFSGDSNLLKLIWMLSNNEELTQELIEKHILNTDNLKLLLRSIGSIYEINKLCKSVSLIEKILSDFLIDNEIVKIYDAIQHPQKTSQSRKRELFQLIIESNMNCNKNVANLEKLSKINKFLNNFNEKERAELVETLQSNQTSQNTLLQLLDVNVLEQYTFDQLKSILTKDDDKKLKTKFNF